MKVKQRVKRIEVTEVDLEFPVYTEHDVGDEHTYIVTTRYELQNPHVPTFLATSITQTDSGFEVSIGQAVSIETDLGDDMVPEQIWLNAVARFARWSEETLAKLRARQS